MNNKTKLPGPILLALGGLLFAGGVLMFIHRYAPMWSFAHKYMTDNAIFVMLGILGLFIGAVLLLLARTLFRIFRSFQARGASADTGRQSILAQQLRVILMLVAADMIPGRPPASGLRNSDIARQAAWFLDEVSDRITPVTELAGKFHLSRNQFTRIFRSFWGISPSEYQIRSRMNQAKYLLSSTDLSIRDIAAELGYADHYFFARQFKQKTGVTPGQFRESGSSDKETVS